MKTLCLIATLLSLGAMAARADSLAALLGETGSHVVLDLDVPLAALMPVIEARVPQTFSNRIDDPAGNLIRNDSITITAERSAIILSTQAGALQATMTATGRANLEGEVLFSDVSKTLNVRVDAVASAHATLTEDWSLLLELEGRATLQQATARVFGIKISLRSLFQDKINRSTALGLQALQDEANTPGYLRDAAADLWADTCQELGKGDARIHITPTRMAVSQPIFADHTLSLTVLISTEIVPGQDEPICPPLPDTLVLIE